jgi:hypothetical protein
MNRAALFTPAMALVALTLAFCGGQSSTVGPRGDA